MVQVEENVSLKEAKVAVDDLTVELGKWPEFRKLFKKKAKP